jgi:hypothetical protein
VVNEFESLDALASPSGQHSIHNEKAAPDTEMKVEHFRLIFFTEKLTQLVAKIK